MKMSVTLIVLLVVGLSFPDGAILRNIDGREASGLRKRGAMVQLILKRGKCGDRCPSKKCNVDMTCMD
uniref:Conotoxin-like unassigned superfamily 03 n=1 Tax=Conus ermineus TaxID=55423 RepID=A0A346CJ12_CONER|nr:conotoxin-like precursor unassigned superfamily 03 [Conus ermineus]